MTRLSSFIIGIFVVGSTWVKGQNIPPLINYQGRLTDASGAPLPTGTYGVAFRLWNSPSLDAHQTLVWGREYDVTIIQGGAFNVILGAPGGRLLADGPAPAVNDLSFAFGESNRFLGLTITRGGGGQAVPNPKEFVPRQQMLTVPFALTAAAVAPHAITSESIAPGAVRTTHLADGSVTQAKRAPANIQFSGVVTNFACNASEGCTGDTEVPNLTVTIETTGRPVFVGLVGGGLPAGSFIWLDYGAPDVSGNVLIFDGREKVVDFYMVNVNALPISSMNQVYVPAAGTHTYKVKITRGLGAQMRVENARLVAYEL